MPEIYTKDKNGKFKSLGNVNVSNLIDTSSLDEYLKAFWADNKSGKHSEMAKKHKDLLNKDLIAKPKDLFDQLNSNRFTFQNFGPFKIANFLAKSKLDSYLKPEYVSDALMITTPQPAIGKGEFLLVSCFKNINFSEESGDLIDDEGHRIEVKGSHAAIGGVKGFDQMNKGIMFSIYNTFGTNPDYDDFTMDCSRDIQQKLIDNNEKCKQVMLLLQNNSNKSNHLADEMVELFNSKINDGTDEKENLLLNIVAAAHLYAYLKLQNANFLFAINDKVFAGFEAPSTLKQSFEIIKNNFKVNGWTTGNRGITFTLTMGG